MKKILFMAVAGGVISLILASCAVPAAGSSNNILVTKVEVSQNGFNNMSGDFHLEVEAGQEVEITFVYKDDSLPRNNPHNIANPEYGIATGTLDQGNPEVTLRFTARETGVVTFSCVSAECTGHHNLHGDGEHDDDDDHGEEEHNDDDSH